MAAAVDAAWPPAAPLSGLVVTRYDYVPPAFRERERAAHEALVGRGEFG